MMQDLKQNRKLFLWKQTNKSWVPNIYKYCESTANVCSCGLRDQKYVFCLYIDINTKI